MIACNSHSIMSISVQTSFFLFVPFTVFTDTRCGIIELTQSLIDFLFPQFFHVKMDRLLSVPLFAFFEVVIVLLFCCSYGLLKFANLALLFLNFLFNFSFDVVLTLRLHFIFLLDHFRNKIPNRSPIYSEPNLQLIIDYLQASIFVKWDLSGYLFSSYYFFPDSQVLLHFGHLEIAIIMFIVIFPQILVKVVIAQLR